MVYIVNREQWIERFKAAHGDLYSYDAFQWPTTDRRGTATCVAHGEFSFLPEAHSRGRGVCRGCKKEELDRLYVERTNAKLKAIHGSKFIANQDDLAARINPCRFTCVEHGEFKAYVNNLTKIASKPCLLCGGERNRQRTDEKMLDRFKTAHGDRYDYSEFEYLGAEVKVTVICRDHGRFKILPGNHYANGVGCSKCKAGRPSKPELEWISLIGEKLGFAPKLQVRIPSGNRNPFLADAVFGNVVVEYDGSYWHSKAKAFDQDERKNSAAQKAGYTVIRLRALNSGKSLPDLKGSLNFNVPEYPKSDLGLKMLDEVVTKIKEINHGNVR